MDVGVVYLWRKSEGPEPARRFARSLQLHPAGMACDLFVILKGFEPSEADGALALFAGLDARPVLLPDLNFDIGAYLLTARRVANRRLLFLNTNSEILGDDWLARYDRALSREGVGLVGATACWRSGFSTRYYRGLWQNLYRIGEFRRDARLFPPFPNPFIRSNAFMIERDRFLALAAPEFLDKRSTYAFESGYDSMTRKIAAMGLATLVVDRHGATFGPDDWEAAHTFYSGDQEGLLIGDKITAAYRDASPEARKTLCRAMWRDPRAAR